MACSGDSRGGGGAREWGERCNAPEKQQQGGGAVAAAHAAAARRSQAPHARTNAQPVPPTCPCPHLEHALLLARHCDHAVRERHRGALGGCNADASACVRRKVANGCAVLADDDPAQRLRHQHLDQQPRGGDVLPHLRRSLALGAASAGSQQQAGGLWTPAASQLRMQHRMHVCCKPHTRVGCLPACPRSLAPAVAHQRRPTQLLPPHPPCPSLPSPPPYTPTSAAPHPP